MFSVLRSCHDHVRLQFTLLYVKLISQLNTNSQRQLISSSGIPNIPGAGA